MSIQRYDSLSTCLKRYTGWMVMLAWLLLPASAAAVPDAAGIKVGEQIYQSGLGLKVPACQKCHGAEGMGSDAIGTPRLASQVYTYLYKQLMDFATDRRTDHVMHQMNSIAKALTDQQRRDVAAYLHVLQMPYSGSNLGKLRKEGVKIGNVARGRTIVLFGLMDRNIPACQGCHGYHGHSAGMMFPAISGQRYMYLTRQLHAFRRAAHGDKTGRSNDYMGAMQAVAVKLTNKDIDDVSAYLTSAKPPPPPNNPMTPTN